MWFVICIMIWDIIWDMKFRMMFLLSYLIFLLFVISCVLVCFGLRYLACCPVFVTTRPPPLAPLFKYWALGTSESSRRKHTPPEWTVDQVLHSKIIHAVIFANKVFSCVIRELGVRWRNCGVYFEAFNSSHTTWAAHRWDPKSENLWPLSTFQNLPCLIDVWLMKFFTEAHSWKWKAEARFPGWERQKIGREFEHYSATATFAGFMILS